jgi:hypothetical protein
MKTRRYFQVAAITFALIFANSAAVYCQSPQNSPASTPRIQTVKDYVQKIGQGKDVTVIMFSGVEYYGAISKIEPDGFEIAEVDLKQMVAISYSDVHIVEKGYGEMNSSTGTRQKGVSSRSFWIFVVVGVASTVGFAVWAFKRFGKRRSEFPNPSIPSPFPRNP